MNEQELKEQLRQEVKQEIKQEMKKTRRKKMIVFFILLLIAIIVFVAIVYIRRNNSAKTISQEELSQYKTEIQITDNNWKDYIVVEDVKNETRNEFGEVESITNGTQIKLKDDICGYLVLKLKVTNPDKWNPYIKNEEQTVAIIGGTDYSDSINQIRVMIEEDTEDGIKTINKKFSIDDIECVQVKGYLYTINLPETIWNTDNLGNQYIYVEDGDTKTMFFKEDDPRSGNFNYIKTLSSFEYTKYIEEINE